MVRVVLSKTAGVGKTLYIRRKKERLVKYLKQMKLIGLNKKIETMATIPLHGPSVTADEVLTMLLDKQDHLQSSIIHLDIPQRVNFQNIQRYARFSIIICFICIGYEKY